MDCKFILFLSGSAQKDLFHSELPRGTVPEQLFIFHFPPSDASLPLIFIYLFIYFKSCCFS